MPAKPGQEKDSVQKGVRSMLELLGILVLWVLLQWVVLPRLGVPT